MVKSLFNEFAAVPVLIMLLAPGVSALFSVLVGAWGHNWAVGWTGHQGALLRTFTGARQG
jgi:hypothetical protein